jgi:hypothetical protein
MTRLSIENCGNKKKNSSSGKKIEQGCQLPHTDANE